MSEHEMLMSFIEENDIAFIHFCFIDMLGKLKNVAVMSYQLERILSHGLSFDASAVPGFSSIDKSDMILVPDMQTMVILPWRPQVGRVAQVFCQIIYPDGHPFELDTRQLLKDYALKLKAIDYEIKLGMECEFYLFELDEKGKPTMIPYDQASYCDAAPLDAGENIRREICETLMQMEIFPESSHHEQGPGQNEVDFRYDDLVESCDHVMMFKQAVMMASVAYGATASFDPKPLKKESGNGLHMNLSLYHHGKHLFSEEDDQTMKYFIAGIMAHIRDITLFLNPNVSSYERLGEKKAPGYISYSHENRSQLIRIPAAKEEYCRIELRSPDPTCNPYLAAYLVAAAGMDGVQQRLLPPSESKENLYLEPGVYEALPRSLEEAKMMAKESEFIKNRLPKEILEFYLNKK